ncbi:serine hydrolase, partial [Streptomonospora halophila]|uniref:serine hydrolase n=1 Tax=Streptomonospora halophila TaxID=427369 RepID=UPI0031EA472D
AAAAVAVATAPVEPPRVGGAAVRPSPAGSGAPIETAAALTPRERDRIAGLLDDHLSGRPGRLALAVQETRTGAAFGYAADTGFSTASAVKLDLVVHMLLRAEERGRFLTDREKALAERMIRYSDNEAADTAYQHNGFTPGFEYATRRLGLRDTRSHQGGAWGLGTTTAEDRLRLLRSVFTPASPLSERSRDHVLSLMGSVAPEQAWGISAAADPAGSARLKNGWAPVRGDGGSWTVHSTGGIVRGEREYLVAVLSDGQPDYGTGVQSVEGAAALVVVEMAEALA